MWLGLASLGVKRLDMCQETAKDLENRDSGSGLKF